MTDLTLNPYTSADELSKILRFVGLCNAATDGCGCLHPGDVVHIMSNALRGRDNDKHLFYHQEGGEILAVVLLYPSRFRGYNLIVHPEHRWGELESQLITWAERGMWALMQAADIEGDWVGSDVMDCDTIRRDLLSQHGYVSGEALYQHYTVRSLLQPIPTSVLPEGFTIRPAEGLHEVDKLSEVHSSAFDSNWQPGEYDLVMQTPGFDIDRELVVVAPDGRFAAFLIYWLDPISKTGLFEPVGCHEEFQRRGLTKALMYEGMRRMIAYGMTKAVVIHDVDNEAATAAYASVGFEIRYSMTDYRKTIR